MAEQGQKSEAALREENILAFWEERHIFDKTLQKSAPKGDFVFYEGPPTANGRPGVHHLEARAFKDAVPRYKTMRGYRVPRTAGWDTHGLPVELEVEKELGFSGKPDIEKYGVAAFNQKCRESVLRYIDLWEKFTKRIGYWVDQGKAYFTFDAPYMESVWAVIKKVADDGRLYKDYKVLPWCARCGTALSSHELAQGYEDVKDLSLTAKFELVDEPGTFLLAWTTTPWTLPGNVALAVGEDIEYGLFEHEGTRVIAAHARAPALGLGTPVRTLKGSDLAGKKYRPLYDFLPSLASESEKQKFNNAYQVYAADFVTTEEGTGIVHTAVMYGADDFELGTKVGLPKVHAVGPDGKFVIGTGFLEGRFVREESVAVDIIKDLAGRSPSLLFSKEKYEHTYPFCWRCKTPLIYYARDSWYIRMTDLRDSLLLENARVHWEPEHIRDGRMGEWLGNVKDWAISRERYWGTPLPVWESSDGSKRMIIGSVGELRNHIKKSGNQYYAVRHGEAENNVSGTLSSRLEDSYGLTEKGREQIKKLTAHLKEHPPTRIYASPILRTRETAEAVATELEFPTERIVYDDRLREFTFGEFEHKTANDFFSWRAQHGYNERLPGGESYQEVKNRIGSFIYELEEKHQNETILIVTHGVGIESLTVITEGLLASHSKKRIDSMTVGHCDPCEFSFAPLPHNDQYELDLHRPGIDEVVLVDESGVTLRRVKEVMDVWLDSGAMPFGSTHYPFEKKEFSYPADFISEAIDQTRGWFYTLLATGILMGRGGPYKNVICLGHLLDQEGKKMSKSRGNVVEPFEAMDRYGADTLRLWMYSVNQAGDAKNFDEKTVREASRVTSWLSNCANFYALFKDGSNRGQEEVIDRWMRLRTNETIVCMTRAMDQYHLYDATRALSALIEDVSQWYVRRIRDRVRDGDVVALTALRETLHTVSRLVAPFAPFIAEEVWQNVRQKNDTESVHLADWPSASRNMFDFGRGATLAKDMERVRETASYFLKLRQEKNIVVRQPLGSLSTRETFSKELAALLADEVNVKKIVQGAREDMLDTNLTPELIVEGDERTFERAVAEARKAEGYSPRDHVRVKRGGGPHTAELSTGPLTFSLEKE